MPTFETSRFSTHFTDTGCGETVVLLHAGGTSSAHWRKVTPLLGGDYRLLAPDLIGFGETVFRDVHEDASHDDQADLVRELLDHTGQQRVHVIGHSFGGATAMRLAVRFPHMIKRLVLIEPVLTPLLRQAGDMALYEDARAKALAFIDDARSGRDVAAWRRFIDGHNGHGTWDTLSDKARERFVGMTVQTAAAYKANLGSPTNLRDLANLAVPTQVICGGKTDDAFGRICEILGAHINSCNVEKIADAAHMSPLTHAEPVVTAIRSHLTTAIAGRPAGRDVAPDMVRDITQDLAA